MMSKQTEQKAYQCQKVIVLVVYVAKSYGCLRIPGTPYLIVSRIPGTPYLIVSKITKVFECKTKGNKKRPPV
jgi:hypothetical protein